MEIKDNIKLPPLHYDELPETDDPIPAMHNYARKAIRADRQRRSVPVACHRCAEYAKEVQALRKDAERYRWLRDGNGYYPEENYLRGGVELDDGIDLSMEKQK